MLWTRTQPGATTTGGKPLAVNPDPDQAGNTAVMQDGAGAWTSRRVTKELPLWGPERLHTPHIATCRAGPRTQLPLELPAGVTRLDDRRRNRKT
ncbi:hypothetical protein [Streptomyces fagopyri]|uniref:hypothetical protein n=1 Tax=Streptomyces fagopyri TaxID=2662397 RepID=UPI0037F9641E